MINHSLRAQRRERFTATSDLDAAAVGGGASLLAGPRAALLGVLCAGLVLTTAACGGGDDANADGAMPDVAKLTTKTEVDCAFDGVDELVNTPTCYEISVPEDWSNPDADDQVVLAAAVFHATDADTAVDDPLIYLSGGPGGSVLDGLGYYDATLVEPHIAERDVILFDQRGVGASTPNLACDEVTAFVFADAEGTIPNDKRSSEWIDANKACADRLAADGVNLAAYNSVASSHDIDAIRTALGYDQLNVLGVSYGTRLAQTYMRLYPDALRSVIIDSVEPVALDVDEVVPVSAKRSLQMVFDACTADTACAEAHPDLEAEYFAALDQLDEKPATVTAQSLDGSSHDLTVDGDLALQLTFLGLYNKEAFELLPQMVSDISEGNYEILTMYATQFVGIFGSISEGMYNSVMCHEEVPFESADDRAANIPDDPNWSRLVEVEGALSNFESCTVWDAGRAADVENEPVESDVPALVLTGSFDPITPPSYAQQVADHLPNSYLFEFPTEGHGTATNDCGALLIGEFLADPSTKPDGSCVDSLPAPRWTTQTGPLELMPFEAAGFGENADLTVSGVQPQDWTEVETGVLVRSSTATDPTLLAIYAIEGKTSAEVLAQYPSDFSEPTTTDVEGQQWETYTSEFEGDQAVVMISPDHAFVVVVFGTPEEIDELVQTVGIPVAASLKIG